MDRKILAILMILLAGAAFLTLGCAGRNNAPMAPTITPGSIVSSQAPAATAGVPSATAAAPTIAPGVPSNNLSLDPSLADISGEGADEGGFPDTGLPTPTLD